MLDRFQTVRSSLKLGRWSFPELSHVAPTPITAELRNHARYLGRDGKLHLFELWGEDDGGIVGKGCHSRAIVELAAIEARAATRKVPVAATAPQEA